MLSCVINHWEAISAPVARILLRLLLQIMLVDPRRVFILGLNIP